jgi:hypothetical protein
VIGNEVLGGTSMVAALADVPRGLTMALGGVVFALALSEAWLYYSRSHDARDPWYGAKRLRYLIVIRLGMALLVLTCVGVVGTYLGEPGLTWRTPAALCAFALLIYGLLGILREDEAVKDMRLATSVPRRRDTDYR